MHLTIESLTSDRIDDVIPLWPDRTTFTTDQFRVATAAAAMLLRDGRAQGSVIRANARSCAAGLTVFVRDDFAEEFHAAPFPHVGRHLLLSAGTAGTPILTAREIGIGNAGSGLQMFVVLTHIAPDVNDRMSVLGKLIQAFVETHAGFHLARIFNEVFETINIQDVRASHAFEELVCFDIRSPGPPSMVGVIDREQARARRSAFLQMFVYSPPRIGFTDAERRLLRTALDGEPDERISHRLGLSLSAVKGRWSRILARAADHLPDLFDNVTCAAPIGRGPQVRHLLLRYVRMHPSELTPYVPTSAREATEMRVDAP